MSKEATVNRLTCHIPGLLGCLAAVAVLTACTSGAPSNSTSASQPASGGASVSGGTATIDMASAPDSLDPQYGYTVEAGEADWITYTPLLTYAHANGEAGTQIIPGLATALPTVSDGGKTYTLTLRSGLKFSNGTPVVASDFSYAVKRMLKLNWGGDSFFTQTVVGASAYLNGKTDSISGITTNNATGQIAIQLTAPYGAFDNLLAFPSVAPVPAGTAMTNLPTNPPPGVGAYVIKDVIPNQSFELVKNPLFAGFHIPGIPTGYLSTIKVDIITTTTTEAEQVLDNQADNFDAADTVPAALLSQINSRAGNRFSLEPVETTYYFFLNQSKPPFNNKLAREAVNIAINRQAFQRLAGGTINPGCYLLAAGLVGHPSRPCPWGTLDSANVTQAKRLIKQAGLAGAPVTVYGEQVAPVEQWVEYYAGVLQSIGLNATIKFVDGSTYFPTVGSRAADPQTGYSAWSEDFPNPVDFYLLVNANSIQPIGNRDRSYVDDPHIQSELAKLDVVPAAQLQSVASEWSALDYYVASQADEAVFGYGTAPKFFSSRINFSAAVFSPIWYNDWSTWQLSG
jgi:peptide/nickel transport system substrate-binding protein